MKFDIHIKNLRNMQSKYEIFFNIDLIKIIR